MHTLFSGLTNNASTSMDSNPNYAVSSGASRSLQNNEPVRTFSVSLLTDGIPLTLTITELASATGEFATAVAELSSSDIGEQLQQTLGTLANVEQAAAEAQSIQSQQDMLTLMSTGRFSFSKQRKRNLIIE